MGLLAAVTVAPSSQARQEAAGVRADSGRVVVSLGALDKEGRPVEGLKAEDLRVSVEGAEQKILSLSSRSEEPLHVVLMLDTSASQERILPVAQLAAAEFVTKLLRPGRDDAAVVSFTGDVEVVEGLTGDLVTLRRAIASVEFVPPSGYIAGTGSGGVIVGNPNLNDPAMRAASTAIWDALVEVCDKVIAPLKEGRRVVVLFTDGVDTSSRMTKDKAVERLLRDGVSVYSIGIGDRQSFEGVDEESLRGVSKRAGGRAFFPKKGTDLPKVFEQLRRELMASYAFELAPAAPKGAGKLNKLHVEVVNPELRARGVELVYPQGFYAGPPQRK